MDIQNNDPLKWMNEKLNSKSKTFCAAKWYNATIWLGNGMTSSCHHPPPHKIKLEEIADNPSALHNTLYKKLVRKEMQEGKQTRECEYCWKIENLKNNSVSDRYFKSVIYDEQDIETAFKTHWNEDISLKTLEISFDSNCNFACSYCNAGYSTTWAKDIKTHGAYKDLNSDGAGAYHHTGEWAMPYGPANKMNPYIDAFWKWWEDDLQYSLNELRVTGGEATVSNDFWKLLDWYNANPECKVTLAVNSNLGIKTDRIDKLIHSSRVIKNFDLYTSNESTGLNAEYIRDGLNWEEWKNNLERLATEGQFRLLHVMLTINSLCLASIDDLLNFIFDLREKTNVKIDTSYNILRFPSFQSITTLPAELKEEKYKNLTFWFEKNKTRFYNHEIHGFQRFLSYIKNVEEGHSVRQHSDILQRQQDFYKFFSQYDKRRNKSIEQSFENWPSLINWVKTFNIEISKLEVPLVDGDASEWGLDIYNDVIATAGTKNE
jgi:organic radical activating enzyme